jgi:peptidoglycan-associated lipoprotein
MEKTMYKLIISTLLSALILGCSSTPLPGDGADGVQVETRGDGTITQVTAGDLDASGLPRVLTDPQSKLSQRSIYFDLDRYEIKGEYQGLVAAHAKYLVDNRGFKVLIQGNTDERGSREYNLALGQKRADAVKRSLLLLGAREDQLESVSLGKEKPKNPGTGEEAWAENRRADILYRAPDLRGEF